MIPRSAWWRTFERPGLAGVVVGLASWTIFISVLHVAVNHRGLLTRPAHSRSLEVGGLPVT